MNQEGYIQSYCADIAACFKQLEEHSDEITLASVHIKQALLAGHKVLLCGNGGSAADAQHIAAELMGRFEIERNPLPAIALTTDTSALTAIANDYGFREVFARQIKGLGRSGDILFAISTSGNSENIIAAVQEAKKQSMMVIGLTGQDGGVVAALCDVSVKVPSEKTSHIQEMHIAVGHMICALVEAPE